MIYQYDTYKLLFDSSDDAMLIIDGEKFVDCNQAALDMLGYASKEELFLVHPSQLSPEYQPDGYASFERANEMIAMAKKKGNHRFEWVHTRANGEKIFVEVLLTAVLEEKSNHTLIYVVWRDITKRKEMEEELQLYACVFQHSVSAMLITNKNNRILAVNAALCHLTGYTKEELIGKNPNFLSSHKMSNEIYQEMWRSLKEKGYWQGELLDKRKDGTVYPKLLSITVIRDINDNIQHYIGTFVDISEQKEIEDKVRYLAHHDALTGLCNRFSLEERFNQAILVAGQVQHLLAVFFIDMDRFKNINDTLGHQAGDSVLIQVSERIQIACRRESDITARIGGDEFIIVINEIENVTAAALIARAMLFILGQVYTFEGKEMYSTPSIGVSIYPNDGNDVETLLRHADTAMYYAKSQGRNNYQFFTQGMNDEVEESILLEHDLRDAINKQQLEVYYQPLISMVENKVIAVEALLRWKHPVQGFIFPNKFIKIAEESQQILVIGEWVLEQVCMQLDKWCTQGITDIYVAINISVQQLQSSNFIEVIKKYLQQYHLKSEQLELEITESVAMKDPHHVTKQLNLLQDIGVGLAIDDFGTGYSSLAYLKMFPIHTLKLDRMFVKNIEIDEDDRAICAASISLAHDLGLKVVAEGVETQAQHVFLEQHQCDILQGYLFSKPLPAKKITSYLMLGS